jgi:cyclophilin family peptidyl-prolyl cis-trans isomerase
MVKVIVLGVVAIAIGVALGLWLPSATMQPAPSAEPVLLAADNGAGGGTGQTSTAPATAAPATQEAHPRARAAGPRSGVPAKQYSALPPMTLDPNKQYTATIQTNQGSIAVELFPKEAPQTVNSFVFLAREGFYDGLIFHRVIKGFMIQGGDPTGTGMGGPGYRVPAEFNAHKHARGVLSMARSSDPNSAGSQFFIVHQDAAHLDGQYTAFGQVVSGIETVDKIASVPTGRNDLPIDAVVIESITIQEK